MELEKELQEKVDFAMNEPLFTKEGCVESAVAFNVPPEQEVFGKRDTSNREEVGNSDPLLKLLLGSGNFLIKQFKLIIFKKMIQNLLHI